MKKTLEDAVVVLNRAILPDVWQMELLSPKIVAGAEPGQFVMVKKPKSAHLLRRPFGVADIDDEKGTITLFYRILGEGTAELSTLRPGETLSVEGALGTGFTLTDEPALLVGGGLGLAPLLLLAHRLHEKPVVIVAARTEAETFWTRFFTPHAKAVYIATDDGSSGFHGYPLHLMPLVLCENEVHAVKVCGPDPMMDGIARLARSAGLSCEVSLEKRMACGFGVCLGCTFEGKATGRRRKVCTEGPVFAAEEVFE